MEAVLVAPPMKEYMLVALPVMVAVLTAPPTKEYGLVTPL